MEAKDNIKQPPTLLQRINQIMPLKVKSTDSIIIFEDPMSHQKNVTMEFSDFDKKNFDDLEHNLESLQFDEDYDDNDIPDDIPVLYKPGCGIIEATKDLLVKFADSKADCNSKTTFTQISTNICTNLDSNNKSENTINIAIEIQEFRELWFSPNIDIELFKNYIFHIYKGLKFIPKSFLSTQVPSVHINLDKFKAGVYKTLFLDLDETLIHSCKGDEKFEYTIQISGKKGKMIKLNVRPFVKRFIKAISRYYQIYIFTASTYSYANVIINFIDPKSKYISGILDRTYCTEMASQVLVKDLRIIKNRDMKDMLIVDNMPHSFIMQKSNGIPILSWYNDSSDCQLKYLADYLIEASFKDNLMDWNEEKLKLGKLLKFREKDLHQKMTSIVF